MIKKNEIYKLEITDVSSDGNGVASIDGMVVFVPHTVTGDIVSVRIVKVNKSYAYAVMTELISASEHRCTAPCPEFGKCGGCSMQHIRYDYQLEIKKRIIENAVKRIGKIGHGVDEMLGAEEMHRYRNKMIFPVGSDRQGSVQCGFYRERSHDIIPLEDCLLGGEFNAEVIAAVKGHMEKFGIMPYDEKNHSGIVRRIFTRCGAVSGEIMVVISVNSDKLSHSEELAGELKRRLPALKSVVLNINKARNNLVLGEKNITLFGEDKIKDKLLGVEYEISPHSFFQINHAQTERLYGKALEYAEIGKEDTVMDIYCGIGTISLSAAKAAGKVIGVEIVPQAIADAKRNAVANRIENAEFYCADAAELVPELIGRGERPSVVILDPPRKGSDEKTLAAIASAAPKRIVYVSCNPATLARDLRFLEDNGYSVKKIAGVDMFPNTSHIECAVQLSCTAHSSI